MRAKELCGVALSILVGLPTIGSAGWVIEWKNTPTRKDERLETTRATAYIAGNRSRVEQDKLTSVYDYKKKTITVMNPKTKRVWSGTIDEFVLNNVKRRNESMRRRLGPKTDKEDLKRLPTLDVDSLPEITVTRTDERKTVAGYKTFKYSVRVNEERFQEIWLAEDLDMRSDIDPEKFLEYQRRGSRGMIGNSAKPFNALYRSEAYLDMLKKGYPLQTVTYHLVGSFEQKAASVRQSDVDDSRFAAPGDYQKTQVSDVFKEEDE